MSKGIMANIRLVDSVQGDGAFRISEGSYVYPSFYHSAFIAKELAEILTCKRFNRDVVLEVVGEYSLAGESFGLMLCLYFMSKLTGMSLKKEITATGRLSADGSVHPAAYLEEKALAARQAGFTVFLYPAANKAPNIEGIDCKPVGNVLEAWKMVTK